MYREQIKVLDCTIRDGGLVNAHDFDIDFVRRVYRGVSAAGVDYFEIGYKNSPEFFPGAKFGPWKCCTDADIRSATEGVENGAKVSVMVDVGRVNMDTILPADRSPYHMVRVASYVKGIDKAIAMENRFHELGYETTINIMAISRDVGPELDEAMDQCEKESHAQAIYLVDSFGSLYQEDIQRLVARARRWIAAKELGFHGHNNQQLAFSNTIESIIQGVNYLDATVYGMGRAAGNCTLELLLGFLKNPKYDVRPILDLVSSDFIPLRERHEWGYIIPHMIAGQLGLHPQEALDVRKGPERENYRAFHDRMTSALSV
ncbi:MAG TPA: aldolase catalytic domain-containing protein [Fibrobacteria bacterium]|nr:aldolase catalytic domain-containing protein [Fibrobacteria bacterium]